MLSDAEISANNQALLDAIVGIYGGTIGSMVVHAVVPISLKNGETILLRKSPMSVRFIHGTSELKFFIGCFDKINFHTEFSTGWQKFRYLAKTRVLIVNGISSRFPQGYTLRLHLKGIMANRYT